MAHEIDEDRCIGRAAELTFFMILALFPLLIAVLTLLTYIPGSRDLAIGYLSKVVPGQAMGLLKTWVNELFSAKNGAILSFSLLFAFWSASGGISALMDTLNVAYDVPEGRSFIKAKLVAIALTVALTLLIVTGCALVVYGHPIVTWILRHIQAPVSDAGMWTGVTCAIGLLLVLAALMLTYKFAPNVDWRTNHVFAGSIFALFGILAGSYLFSIYLKYGPSYSKTYGSLGAVVVLMLWLYLIGLVVMIGGEINSQVVRSSGRKAAPRIEGEEAA